MRHVPVVGFVSGESGTVNTRLLPSTDTHHLKIVSTKFSFTPFARSKQMYHNLDCDLDRNAEDVPIYMGHSLFNTAKPKILLLIVQILLHRNIY